MRYRNMVAEFNKGEKLERCPGPYTDSFTAKNGQIQGVLVKNTYFRPRLCMPGRSHGRPIETLWMLAKSSASIIT